MCVTVEDFHVGQEVSWVFYENTGLDVSLEICHGEVVAISKHDIKVRSESANPHIMNFNGIRVFYFDTSDGDIVNLFTNKNDVQNHLREVYKEALIFWLDHITKLSECLVRETRG